jgi:hypothetical protein
MPVGELVNGTSIAHAESGTLDAIEYFHLALETHEVISAEGAAAETLFIQDNEHEVFANFAEYQRLAGPERIAMESFAPRVWYSGGRSHLKAGLHLEISKFVDIRDPIQKAQQRLAQRAAARVLQVDV